MVEVCTPLWSVQGCGRETSCGAEPAVERRAAGPACLEGNQVSVHQQRSMRRDLEGPLEGFCPAPPGSGPLETLQKVSQRKTDLFGLETGSHSPGCPLAGRLRVALNSGVSHLHCPFARIVRVCCYPWALIYYLLIFIYFSGARDQT